MASKPGDHAIISSSVLQPCEQPLHASLLLCFRISLWASTQASRSTEKTKDTVIATLLPESPGAAWPWAGRPWLPTSTSKSWSHQSGGLPLDRVRAFPLKVCPLSLVVKAVAAHLSQARVSTVPFTFQDPSSLLPSQRPFLANRWSTKVKPISSSHHKSFAS